MNDERVGLLSTIRERRKWYLGIYFLQLAGWLVAIIVLELTSIRPMEAQEGQIKPPLKSIIDTVVAMSFLSQGTLVTTIFLIDVVFDGSRNLTQKGKELMGLLFTPYRNRHERRGQEEGREEALKLLSKQLEDNPNLDAKEAIEQVRKEYEQTSRNK